MMGIIIWLIVGGVCRLAGQHRSCGPMRQQGIFLNIVVGIVGSFIGGLVLLRCGKINNDGIRRSSSLIAASGRVILLAIVNLVRRGSVR